MLFHLINKEPTKWTLTSYPLVPSFTYLGVVGRVLQLWFAGIIQRLYRPFHIEDAGVADITPASIKRLQFEDPAVIFFREYLIPSSKNWRRVLYWTYCAPLGSVVFEVVCHSFFVFLSRACVGDRKKEEVVLGLWTFNRRNEWLIGRYSWFRCNQKEKRTNYKQMLLHTTNTTSSTSVNQRICHVTLCLWW